MADLDFNSAYAQQALSGPTDVGQETQYVFGDRISGAQDQKLAQRAQAKMDYDEFLRNEYSAKQQREFEEYLDSTKVQRSMKDIEAAGLNPWLAVQNAGFGGSTPSTAAASSSAGQVGTSTGKSAAATIGSSAVGLALLFKTIASIITKKPVK